MAQVYEVDGVCPVCGDAMLVTRLGCERCGSSLEGVFHLSAHSNGGSGAARSGPLGGGRNESEARFGRLARLDRSQIEFVEAFLQCRGIIKNVEDMLGISYPTVKARLNDVIAALGFAVEEDAPQVERGEKWREKRREVLADLAAGRITTAEAHEKLMRAE